MAPPPHTAQPQSLAVRQSARLRQVFERERFSGLKIATYARLVALGVIAIWLAAAQREISVVYYLGVIAVFAVLAVLQLALSAGARRAWVKYFFTAAEMALLAWVLINPNPFADLGVALPPAMLVRGQNFLYFFVLLALTALSLSPGYVVWSGVSAAAAWSGGVLWVIDQPGTVTVRSFAEYQAMTLADRTAALFDPDYVDLVVWQQQVLLLLVVTMLLALAVYRARLIAERQARLERERASLARYFSPNMVDELTRLGDPLGAVRSQKVAVLFCDLAGFTTLAATETPERVVGLLRELYARLEAAVFSAGGTLDKYFGDAMMATFGTPRTGSDDAIRALRCGLAIRSAVAEWNRERAGRGEPVLRIGIGLHYGPVVLGNIGGERRLEFTAIGDTVNVASRIQALTRDLQSDLLVSAALVEQIRREADGRDPPELAGFVEASPVVLRGRDNATGVWMFGDASSVAAPAADAAATSQ